LKVVQIEDLLQMRDENVIKVDSQRPEKKQGSDENEWGAVTSLGEGC
jgi:hypothetical protein